MEYYKQNKVLSYTVNEDGSCEGIVAGSGDGNYHVHIDMEHPRKSTCDCPLANGKKIICKHIVAVSLCLDESEADRFKNEKTIYASEEEERRAKKEEATEKSVWCKLYKNIGFRTKKFRNQEFLYGISFICILGENKAFL